METRPASIGCVHQGLKCHLCGYEREKERFVCSMGCGVPGAEIGGIWGLFV